MWMYLIKIIHFPFNQIFIFPHLSLAWLFLCCRCKDLGGQHFQYGGARGHKDKILQLQNFIKNNCFFLSKTQQIVFLSLFLLNIEYWILIFCFKNAIHTIHTIHTTHFSLSSTPIPLAWLFLCCRFTDQWGQHSQHGGARGHRDKIVTQFRWVMVHFTIWFAVTCQDQLTQIPETG